MTNSFNGKPKATAFVNSLTTVTEKQIDNNQDKKMIDKNDPRLTAFVLGELDEAAYREITAAIDASPELQTVVDEIRETIGLLDTTYQSDADVALDESQQVALDNAAQSAGTQQVELASTRERRFYRESLFYWTIGIAAVLMLMLIPLSSYFGGSNRNSEVARNGRMPELPTSMMLPPADLWGTPSPSPTANPDALFTSVTPEVQDLVDAQTSVMDEEENRIHVFDSAGNAASSENPESSEFETETTGVVIVRDGVIYTFDGTTLTGKNPDRLLDDALARNEQQSKADELDRLEVELNELTKEVFETDPQGELRADVENNQRRDAVQDRYLKALQRAKELADSRDLANLDSEMSARNKSVELALKGVTTNQLGAVIFEPRGDLSQQQGEGQQGEGQQGQGQQGEGQQVEDQQVESQQGNGQGREGQQTRLPTIATVVEFENSASVDDAIARLAADRERVVSALEGGKQSAEEMFWILRQNRHITTSSFEERTRFQNTESLRREISQMELALSKQNARLGSDHPRAKALKDQIKFWKDYVAKSDPDDAGKTLEKVDPEAALRMYLLAIDEKTEELKNQSSPGTELEGHEKEIAQQLVKKIDPTGTREIYLPPMVPELGIFVLEGAEEDVARIREIVEVLTKESEGSVDNGKRLLAEFKKATAEHNQEVRKNKTWKRVKAVPNTTRLMVGDKEELELNGMQVNVQVDGFRARVLIDCFYYNHFDRQLEGKFKLRLPDDASLYYFAFGQSVYKYEQNGPIAAEEFLPNNRQFVSLQAGEIGRVRQDAWNNVKEARMVPREKAAHAYSQTVRKRVDPALVEWSGAGVFNANVFPLMPHKLHRVVIGYDVDLTQTDEGLVYELNLPEQTGECRVSLNVLELENAEYSITPTVEPVLGVARSERVKDEQFDEVAKLEQRRNQMLQQLGKSHPEIRKLDSQIDALMANRKRVADDGGIAQLVERQYRFENPKTESIKLTLATAGSLMLRSDDAKEGSFWSTRITPPIPQVAAKTNDRAVFLVDTSLSSQPDKFNVWLKLLESTLENNRESLKKFAVVFFNVENHFWQDEYVDNNADNVAALKAHCQNLALEGATDLYGALERVDKTDWISADNARPDLFLLSDGAANWGETNLQLINRLVASENLGSLFAYQTGMTGTAIANLRSIAGQSGGAVFSVASEYEINRASTAHTQRPWRLTGIEVDGTSDVMTAGRVQWVYPGQSLTIVGRIKDVDAAALGSVRLLIDQAGEQKTIDIPMATEVKTDLAGRMYGQVAVGQLESLGELALDVATAYARHFRITGQSCSLLMLESEADYQRFDIKPEDDLFVIKTRDAKRLINTTLESNATELADPKQQLVGWLTRLESIPGMNFKMPTALKLAMEDIQVVAISEPLKCEPTLRDSASDEYLKALTVEQLDYSIIKAESKRRFDDPKYRQPNDEALKVLSSLVERNPGDLVLAKDVAYAAMELHRPAQAYHLLRRVTEARPYEGSNYFALGQCLSQLGQADMAMVYYEVAITSNFQNRDQDFKRIAATEYAHMLRKVVDEKQDSAVKDYASARLQSLTEELNIRPADVVVTMMWNTDQTDVDLHVIEPSGEECFYQHKSTKSGGKITSDITDGFGPEMYSLANAPDGEYQVLVKYYASNQNRTDLRSKVYLSIYREFGRPTASVTRKTVELSEVGGKEVVDTLQVK